LAITVAFIEGLSLKNAPVSSPFGKFRLIPNWCQSLSFSRPAADVSPSCPSPVRFPFSAFDGEKVAEGRMRCSSRVERVVEVLVRKETTMSLKWVAQHLAMGSWTHVSNLLAAWKKQESLKSED
jgi:hypothetical protein